MVSTLAILSSVSNKTRNLLRMPSRHTGLKNVCGCTDMMIDD